MNLNYFWRILFFFRQNCPVQTTPPVLYTSLIPPTTLNVDFSKLSDRSTDFSSPCPALDSTGSTTQYRHQLSVLRPSIDRYVFYRISSDGGGVWMISFHRLSFAVVSIKYTRSFTRLFPWHVFISYFNHAYDNSKTSDVYNGVHTSFTWIYIIDINADLEPSDCP